MEYLLSSGASIMVQPSGTNALAAACTTGSREVVELLLSELSGTTLEETACGGALESAAKSGDDEMFQMLLDRCGSFSRVELSQACAASLENSVRTMLGCGLDPNGEDGEGSRPLHTAASNFHYAIVELLAAHRADINHVTDKSGSPLQATIEGLLYITFGDPLQTFLSAVILAHNHILQPN